MAGPAPSPQLLPLRLAIALSALPLLCTGELIHGVTVGSGFGVRAGTLFRWTRCQPGCAPQSRSLPPRLARLRVKTKEETADEEDKDTRRDVVFRHWNEKGSWEVRDELERMGIEYEKEDTRTNLLELLVEEITALSYKYSPQTTELRKDLKVAAAWEDVVDVEAQKATLARLEAEELRKRIEGNPTRASPPRGRLSDYWEKEQHLRKQIRKQEWKRSDESDGFFSI